MATVDAVPRLGEFGILIEGARIDTAATFEVRSPFDGSLVAIVHHAGATEIERAIAIEVPFVS